MFAMQALGDCLVNSKSNYLNIIGHRLQGGPKIPRIIQKFIAIDMNNPISPPLLCPF
jgi:hypothetical protein